MVVKGADPVPETMVVVWNTVAVTPAITSINAVDAAASKIVVVKGAPFPEKTVVVPAGKTNLTVPMVAPGLAIVVTLAGPLPDAIVVVIAG